MTPSVPWPRLLDLLLERRDLEPQQASALMNGWLSGAIEPVLTGALLAALRAKGVSGSELAAMAVVLREASPVPAARPALPLVDTCGTGGSGVESFNISTAVAFTAAACGATVAKHGNRSASGRVGSADVLEALGVDLAAPPERVLAALREAGVTFLFAPGWHPALVGLAPLRRSLGVRTVFNQLGPLVNPLRPETQVLGVARADQLEPMAEALARLGQGRVPAGGEQEGHTRLRQSRHPPFGGGRQIESQGLQHIGRTDTTTGAAVAMLGHMGATGGGGEGHGGGNVEAVESGAAGAAGIHQGKGGPGGRHGRGLPQHGRHGRQFRATHPLGPQASQQGAGEHRFDLPGQPAVHQRGGLLLLQIPALKEAIQEPGPGDTCCHGREWGSGS